MTRTAIGTAAALLALCGALAAQGASQEELRARLEKKRASPFLEKASWTLDYDTARAAAREQGLLIFAYFTRSYLP